MLAILLIEDDDEIRSFLEAAIGERGYRIESVGTVTAARAVARNNAFDVMIVDRLLPDGDGLQFVEELRRAGNWTPILILSALGDIDHRIDGLDAGGDDYLTKPFDIAELIARIEALHRRRTLSEGTTTLEVGDLRLDLIKRRAFRDGQALPLQPREFKLLEFLVRHSGQVVTRTMLLEGVWGYSFDPQTNVVDVHISRLRNKLDRGYPNKLLHTVRGEGYRLDVAR